MDPTRVLELVRKQRRQINETFAHNPKNSDNDIMPNHQQGFVMPSEAASFSRQPTYTQSEHSYNNNYYVDYFNYNNYRPASKLYVLNNKGEVEYLQPDTARLRANYERHGNQIESMSRSGSVKSVASDSGVGSTSPLSDCSDFGQNNNFKSSRHNSTELLMKPQQAGTSPFKNNMAVVKESIGFGEALVMPKELGQIDKIKILTKIDLTEEQKKTIHGNVKKEPLLLAKSPSSSSSLPMTNLISFKRKNPNSFYEVIINLID